MRISQKWFRWSVLASILVFAAVFAAEARAAEPRTAAVISIADLDSAVKSLKAVTTQAGYPEALAQFETSLEALEGVNTKLPIGVVIQADDETVGGYAFLPIADISATPLGPLAAMGEKQKDGSILLPPMSPFVPQLYIKQASKWLFVSIKELPSKLPDDPSKLLEGLDKQYILGLKANVNNLPKDLVANGLAFLRNMAEQQAKNENDIEALDAQFESIETALAEIKTFTFGIAVTPENDVVFDTVSEVVPGTTLAGDVAAAANAKTSWSGFYQAKNTIFTFVNSGNVNAQAKKQLKAQIKSFFEGAREGIKEGDAEIDVDAAAAVLDNLQAVLASSIESGKIDAAASWKADGTLLAALSVANGKKLQDALEKIAAVAPEEYQSYIKLNDSQIGDYAVSSVIVPISEWCEMSGVTPEFPEKLNIKLYIAVKENGFALSLGLTDTVLDDLKKAIDASKTAVPLPETQLVISPRNIENFFKLIGPSNSNAGYEQTMDIVTSIPADAQITLSVKFEERTAKNKLVISNKLLPVIGKFIGMRIEAVQEAAQRMRCTNNLKQLALAMHNYHDAYRTLPPAYTIDNDGKPLHSWRVLILPFLEQQALYDQIHLNEPWDSDWNKKFHNVVIPTYQCPSSSSSGGDCNYSVVVGKETPFTGGKPLTFASISDGTSNTLMIIERLDSVCWMDPTQELTYEQLSKNGITPNEDAKSEHVGGVNAALCDGTARFLPETLDLQTLKALLNKSDGKDVDMSF